MANNTPINISVEAYLTRLELRAHVSSAINGYYAKVKNLVIPDGCKLKRTDEDYLIEKGMFNSGDLISEFNKILEKRSNLPSGVRKKVQEYVFQGIYTLHQSDVAKAQREQELKPKDHGNEEESRG